MKRLASLLTILAASMLFTAVPVLAAEEAMGEGETVHKDECLLVAKNCGDSVDSLVQRIDRLNHEISKGTAVYTSDELTILKGKLDNANELLSDLLHG